LIPQVLRLLYWQQFPYLQHLVTGALSMIALPIAGEVLPVRVLLRAGHMVAIEIEHAT
jgi:hypothetical protein